MRLQPTAQPMHTFIEQPSERAIIRYPTIEDQQQRITTLIYELLAAKLEASKRLAEHTHTDWLDRQSAEGLAELGEFLDRTSAGMLTLLARPGRSATDDDTAILDVAE